MDGSESEPSPIPLMTPVSQTTSPKKAMSITTKSAMRMTRKSSQL